MEIREISHVKHYAVLFLFFIYSKLELLTNDDKYVTIGHLQKIHYLISLAYITYYFVYFSAIRLSEACIDSSISTKLICLASLSKL